MRVGFGSTVLAKGLAARSLDGIGHYAQDLGQHLLANGVELLPVTFGPARVKQLFNLASYTLPRFPYATAASGAFGVSYLNSSKLMSQIDVFHATDHHIPRLLDVPVLATIMDAIPLARPEWASSRLRSLKNALWKQTVSWADHIVTISEFSKADIVKYFDVPPESITVVPLGVDARYFQPVNDFEAGRLLTEWGLQTRQFYLFIGTLQPRKNVNALVDAYLALPERTRAETKLVIVGRKGWGCEKLAERLNEFDETPLGDVLWLTDISDYQKRVLLQNATALVFPSLYEGFGLPVLEAFASSLPVITSNTTSLPEVAKDAAILIDPESTLEMAAAMRQIADDGELRTCLGRRGKARARAFTWDECARRTVECYQRLL